MSDNRTNRIDEYLPVQGLLYFDEQLKYVISKPKIMPLKSITLEKVCSSSLFQVLFIEIYVLLVGNITKRCTRKIKTTRKTWNRLSIN